MKSARQCSGPVKLQNVDLRSKQQLNTINTFTSQNNRRTYTAALNSQSVIIDIVKKLPTISTTLSPTTTTATDLIKAPSAPSKEAENAIISQVINAELTETQGHALQEIIRSCIKNMLDLTFEEEIQLEEKDFPMEALPRVEAILNLFRETPLKLAQAFYHDSISGDASENKAVEEATSSTAAEDLVGEFKKLSNPHDTDATDELITLIGVDLMEVLLYRRGNLVYMQTHTAFSAAKQQASQVTLSKAFIRQGIEALDGMFGVRSAGARLRGLDGPETSDVDVEVRGQGGVEVASLIKDNIFSSQHLLALMYAGEMCYWLYSIHVHQNETKSTDTTTPTASIDTKVTDKNWKTEALSRLEKFVRVIRANKSLKKTWNINRAQELIVELKSTQA